MRTLTAQETKLVVEQCWCGIWHAIPESLHDLQKRNHRDGEKPHGIYCPVGHRWILAGEGESAKLRRLLTRGLADHDQTKAALTANRLKLKRTEASRRAEKAAKTRLKNRARAGVCAFCNRTFTNIARHMDTKHKDQP